MKHIQLPNPGFSLAETLIVIVVLGFIATLVMPMVGSFNASKHYPKLLKTSILSLEQVTEGALIEGQVNVLQAAVEKLEATKTCTNATTQGCWTTSSQGALVTNTANTGIVLSNGVSIAGLNTNTLGTNHIRIMLDANAEAAPNTDGQDQIILEYCTNETYCSTNATYTTHAGNGFNVKPGTLIPATTASATLYNNMFDLT